MCYIFNICWVLIDAPYSNSKTRDAILLFPLTPPTSGSSLYTSTKMLPKITE